ncbi:unnamed protein product, partial [Prorocentrum cordatum]
MSKKSGAGEISQTVDESNKLREKLGIKPLAKEGESKSKKGTSNDPVHAPANASKDEGPSAAEVKRRTAAAKTRREHAELVSGEGLGDILAREEKGGASDWVSKTRNSDGSMKATGSVAAADAKKRKAEAEAVTAPKMKVRHDASKIGEGETVVMTLADKPLLDKDGNLAGGEDELSNVR